MDCPACTTTLGSYHHLGEAVHGCSTCTGRFLAFAALKAVLERAATRPSGSEAGAALEATGTASSRPDDGAPPRSCPACSAQMRRYVYQYDTGVWIDACETDGVWLDAGELERLEALAAADSNGAVRPPSEQVSTVGTKPPPIARLDVHDPYGHAGRGPSSFASHFLMSDGDIARHRLTDSVVAASRQSEAALQADAERRIEEVRTLAEAIVAAERADADTRSAAIPPPPPPPPPPGG